ncbi:MAG: dihydroxy-acid dehydratase, partial [Bauldia sp.]
TPVLVNLKPVGSHYMEDLFAAGGLDAVLRELKPLLDLSVLTVTGETLGEILARPPIDAVDRTVVAAHDAPIEPLGGLVALFGSLAPGGAILKRSAADKRLLEHTGRAVVFASLDDLAARIDADDLDVTADDILVLQNAGPRSEAAMPEAGYLPIPKKLARAGVKDMVRISDARMSGTAYGAVVLHVTPEAAAGGPLALVRTGDRIRLSVKDRRLDLLVDEAELDRRRNSGVAMAPGRAGEVGGGASSAAARRGYDRLYHDHVLQADEGCDFDFC